jgi:predicted ATPase/class 3 adenylate cyclase
MPQLPSGTVTFLFTDIEGSTRLLGELGDDYDDVLAEHRRLLREAFERHGGVEVDTQGDAFFVSFARASDATAAAAAAQEALASTPVRVRMGIHTGEPRTTDEGYVGIDVHRAARIGNAANGGQIVISPATRQLVDAEAELKDLGEHRLKDFPGPTRLFQLGGGDFPPLRTPDEARLPTTATPMVGRKKELADAVRMLSDGVRLLTVTGPGGVGKTRFAIEAAVELLESFTDGARFVDLAPLRSPNAVLPAISTAVRARGSLEDTLREQEALLVLDNAEHVADAAPDLRSLLEACPSLSLLVTSREPLHLSLEQELPLRPMGEAPAVELFRRRVRMADPTFDGDYAAIAEICSRLDGLPLAIELAAARVKVLGVKGLLERLEQRLPLLVGRNRDVPERQRTLRATLEWSYGLLDPDEQRVFAALSVFAGGFDLTAAEGVAGADLGTLESLVDKSLVRRENGRLSMLETIREFAGERREDSPEGDSTKRRHAEHFLEVVEPLFGFGADTADRLRQVSTVEREYENTLAAVEWFRRSGDAKSEVRILCGCVPYWVDNGPWEVGRRYFEDILARYREPNDLRAWALWTCSMFAWRLGDPHAGLLRAREARLLAQSSDDEDLRYYAALELAINEDHVGDHEASRRHYEEAANHARAAGSAYGVSMVLHNLGNLELVRGDLTAAREYLEQAVAVDREHDLRGVLANSVVDLGFVALRDRREDDAVEHFAESLELSVETERREILGWALVGLAATAGRMHGGARAATLLGAAWRLHATFGVSQAYFKVGEEIKASTASAARAELGEAEFERAFAEGQALSQEQAVQLARSSVP